MSTCIDQVLLRSILFKSQSAIIVFTKRLFAGAVCVLQISSTPLKENAFFFQAPQ